jgi:ubiquinone/menaquinone biosynthesis C-methylase UbiE
VTQTGSEGWESVAKEWAEFARSGADRFYPSHSEAFLELLPPPGRLTLDVGCGEGRITRRLGAAGHTIVGVDASPTLIELAADADLEGDYRVADASSLPLEDDEADLVVSFLALQDIEELDGALREVGRVLGPEGAFCFAIVHPVASAAEVKNGMLIIERYLTEEPVVLLRPLFEREVTQFHRPLASYFEALSAVGLRVTQLRELPAEPGRELPMFAHVRAVPER